jgi:hypothetical protein
MVNYNWSEMLDAISLISVCSCNRLYRQLQWFNCSIIIISMLHLQIDMSPIEIELCSPLQVEHTYKIYINCAIQTITALGFQSIQHIICIQSNTMEWMSWPPRVHDRSTSSAYKISCQLSPPPKGNRSPPVVPTSHCWHHRNCRYHHHNSPGIDALRRWRWNPSCGHAEWW